MSDVKRYWVPSGILQDQSGWHQDDTCVVQDWAYDALAQQLDASEFDATKLRSALESTKAVHKSAQGRASYLATKLAARDKRLEEAMGLLRDLEKGSGTSPGANRRWAKVRAFLSQADGAKEND